MTFHSARRRCRETCTADCLQSKLSPQRRRYGPSGSERRVPKRWWFIPRAQYVITLAKIFIWGLPPGKRLQKTNWKDPPC